MPAPNLSVTIAGITMKNPLTVGSGTIADCFRQEERGKVMSVWTLPVLLGKPLNLVYFGRMFRSLLHCLSNIRAKLTELK